MKKIQMVLVLCTLLVGSLLVLASCAAPAAAPSGPPEAAANEPAAAPEEAAAPAPSEDQANADNPSQENTEDPASGWVMAAPRNCDPDNAQYDPLRSDAFWNQRIEDAETVAYAKIEYANELGQRFDIYVYGNNSEEGRTAITQYVESARVCLEAIEDNSDTGVLYTPAEMDELQAGETLEELIPESQGEDYVYWGDWQEFLVQSPSSLVIRFGPTMPEILTGVDGWDRLVVSAISGSGGDLDPVLVDELRTFAASIQPQLEENIFGTDQVEFVNWFVFEFSQVFTTVHFSFDPPIAATADGGTINYKAWCNKKSARLIMTSQLNEPEVSFWKTGGYGYSGVPVSQGSTFNKTLRATPDDTASFDALVRGGAYASQYTISGGWVQGSGCR